MFSAMKCELLQQCDFNCYRNETLKDTYGREFILPDFTIKEILDAIPPECFNRSAVRGLCYVLRDLVLIALTGVVALYTIPSLPNTVLRSLGWMVYAFVQGCFGTGLWVLAHECGHQAFSRWSFLNDSVGWVLHSFLLVPYFSWKITHSKHYKATCHMLNDVVFVPKTLSFLIKRRGGYPAQFSFRGRIDRGTRSKTLRSHRRSSHRVIVHFHHSA